RHINEELGTHVGILADLQGPKLRVGTIKDEPLMLNDGDVINFVNYPCEGTKEAIYMSYQTLAEDVKQDEIILVDDGKIQLKVLETNNKDLVKLEVLHGGNIRSNKGVNLPNTKVKLPALTEKDLKDLDFILTQPVNWIALSFVRSPDDLDDLKQRMAAKGHPAKVISKIEKPEALERIDDIIKASNGIMIARGDLGIETPIEGLALTQKSIIAKCIQWSRPVIVATQMMESMMENPTPTRPEVTDVANAVLDGCDAVMCSGETAMGKYPVEVIETMGRIIRQVEQNDLYQPRFPEPSEKSSTFANDVICYSAVDVAKRIKAKVITGMTVSGYTAFRVSSRRPKQKICIFSGQTHILATLNLVWGVKGFYYDRFNTTDETIEDVVQILKAAGEVETGDFVVNIASMPLQKRLRTNMLRVTQVE
ncbi:MAG: pyruvate kinase, partial [Bacteroidetes bacterium]|nr:pyruvate kinase [Bacteroidota bacterium]